MAERDPAARGAAALLAVFGVLFLVVCLGTRRLAEGLASMPALAPLLARAAADYAAPPPALVAALKSALFLAGLAAAFGAAAARGGFARPRVEAADRVAVLATLGLLAALAGVPPALGSWGAHYMQMAQAPFLDADPVAAQFLYRRVLHGFVAHVLQLDGVLFPLFNWILTFVLLLLTRLYLRGEGVPAGIAVLASVGSCQFVIYNYMLPGYPDQLVFILGLAAVLIARDGAARLVLFGAALLAHESLALAVFLPLVLFRFPAEERVPHLALVGLYGAAWLLGHGGDLAAGVVAQTTDGAHRPLALLLARPALLPLAALVTLKWLWLSLGVAVAAAWRAGDRRAAAFLAVGALLPLATAPVALDMSRLFAASLIAALAGLAAFARAAPRALPVLLAANVVTPSFYVGLNTGAVAPGGLYGLMLSPWLAPIP